MYRYQFDFMLPNGYMDEQGILHKQGVMRLAKVADEMLLAEDSKAIANPDYAMRMLLSRVIVQLGTLSQINIELIENLSVADYEYLKDFYDRINGYAIAPCYHAECPHCGEFVKIPLDYMIKG